jgi:hypothetical protein
MSISAEGYNEILDRLQAEFPETVYLLAVVSTDKEYATLQAYDSQLLADIAPIIYDTVKAALHEQRIKSSAANN